MLKRVAGAESQILALIPESYSVERIKSEIQLLENKFHEVEKRPIFYGIPIGVKDIFNINGFETRCGSVLPPDNFRGNESEAVSILKNQGSYVFAKTVTTEFAYFEPGPTRNPHNISHTPGGSSSGSAAAVACGYVPLALGTQTIGSIIRPAAYCGIVGYKPSYGRISTKGVHEFSRSSDHIGTFTQDLAGAEIAATVLCLNFKMHNFSTQKPVIGMIEGNYLKQADSEINTIFEHTISQLSKAGFKIVRLPLLEDIEEVNKTHKMMNSAEMAMARGEEFEKHESFFRKATRDLILDGRKFTVDELINARNGRFHFRERIQKAMKDNGIDLWLSPATTTPAPEGMATGSPLMNLPWSFAGMPSLTLPVAKSSKNLPVGLQICGNYWHDEEMFIFSKQIAQIFDLK
jgi:Asp-tRNA(Asn)/Glu-tRNA(Gln) amidotransferase A subunit family amidase